MKFQKNDNIKYLEQFKSYVEQRIKVDYELIIVDNRDSKTEEIRKLFETGTEKEILQYLDIFKTPELIEIPQESLSKKVILKLIEIEPDDVYIFDVV